MVHIGMIKSGSQRKRYSRAIAEPRTKKKVMGEGVRGERQKEMPFVRRTLNKERDRGNQLRVYVMRKKCTPARTSILR